MRNATIESIASGIELLNLLILKWCKPNNIDLYNLVGNDNQIVFARSATELDEKLRNVSIKTSIIRVFEAYFTLVKYINAASTLLGNDNYQIHIKRAASDGNIITGWEKITDEQITFVVATRLLSQKIIETIINQGRFVHLSIKDLDTILSGIIINTEILNHLFHLSKCESMALFIPKVNKYIRADHMAIAPAKDSYYFNELSNLRLHFSDLTSLLTVFGQVQASIIHVAGICYDYQ